MRAVKQDSAATSVKVGREEEEASVREATEPTTFRPRE